MKVPVVTIKQYIEGYNRDQVDYVLKYGDFKPDDTFNLGDITTHNFGVVKDCQHLFNVIGASFEKYIDLLIESFAINKNVIANESIYKVYQSRLWMLQQIEALNELESSNLGHESGADEQAAGIDRFNKYGNDLQFTQLAGSDDWQKKKDVESWPYTYCFMVLKKQKDYREFEEEINRIRSRKKI